MKRALRSALARAALALSVRREVHGLPVYFDPDSEDVEALAIRIAAALQLIHASAPRRWRRLLRDVRGVRCTILGTPGGQYDPSTGSCEVDVGYVRRWPASHLAATMIHEATHARIDRAGIAYIPEQRHRIERRCMIEEIAFVEGLPGDHAALLVHLRSAIGSVWYSEEQLAARSFNRLRALGVPVWMIHWMQRRSERRARRGARPAA